MLVRVISLQECFLDWINSPVFFSVHSAIPREHRMSCSTCSQIQVSCYVVRWTRKIAASRVCLGRQSHCRAPLPCGCSRLFSPEVSIGRDPNSLQRAAVQSVVKSTQKIPYSSVGFGLGTCRDEKNCSNSQCLVNISKSEDSTWSKKERSS